MKYSRIRRIFPVLLSTLVVLFYVGCGGGDEEPPYDPTADQKEALRQLHIAADEYRQDLAADAFDKSKDKAKQDQMMNIIMMYMTADNGQSANQPGAMEYLVWYIKGYIANSAAEFAGYPPDAQQSIMGRLGNMYSSSIGSADPALAALANQQVSPYLGNNPNLPGAGSLAGYNYMPAQSLTFKENTLPGAIGPYQLQPPTSSYTYPATSNSYSNQVLTLK